MHKPSPHYLLLVLALTACNTVSTPAPVIPPLKTDFVQPTSIEGTIQVPSIAKNATIRSTSSNGLDTLSSTSITSSGGQFTFSLPLPNASLVSKLKGNSVAELTQGFVSSADCTGDIKISNLLAKIYALYELQLVEGATTTTLANIIASSSGGVDELTINGWVYSVSNVSVVGTLTCASSNTTRVANLYLKPGWNVIQERLGKSGLTLQSLDPLKTIWHAS